MRPTLENIRHQRLGSVITLMYIFGSGGHSAEMMSLIEAGNLQEKYKPPKNPYIESLVFIRGDDDEEIERRLDHLTHNIKATYVTISRPRKVGQSYISSIFSAFLSFIEAIRILHFFQSGKIVVITNGPGISVTFLLALRFLELIYKFVVEVVYVESFCRTKTLSMTGQIIYKLKLADHFYVQWPELVKLYPKAQYRGILV